MAKTDLSSERAKRNRREMKTETTIRKLEVVLGDRIETERLEAQGCGGVPSRCPLHSGETVAAPSTMVAPRG